MLPRTTLLATLLCGGWGLPLEESSPTDKPPLQPKISYSRETVGKPGQNVTIDCGVEGIDLSGVQDFGISWSKIDLEKPTNSYPISSGENVVLFSSKYRVLHPAGTYQYSLQILDIDEEDTGTYRCVVNFGGDQKITAEVPVLIEKAPYFLDPSTKTLTVTKGDAISIDCQPGGSPRPTVFWERVNHELPFYGGNFFKDNQLEIPSVEPSHEGRYVCHADNGIGAPAKSEVVLSVQYLPVVTLSASVVAVTPSDSVNVTCTVDAYPAAEVSWLKDGETLLGDVNVRISHELVVRSERAVTDEQFPAKPSLVVSSLSLAQASVDDLGSYTCQAVSTLGAANATVEVAMKTPPKIERQSQGRVFYNDDKLLGRTTLPVSIECEASGVPAPEYRWTRNGQPLLWQSSPRMSLEPSTGSLLIEEPTTDDNGWYQCVAYNDLGVAKGDPVYLLNSTRVSFKEDEQSFSELLAEEGRPFRMDCPTAVGEPQPTIVWTVSHPPDEEGNSKMQFFSSNRTVVGPGGSAYFTHVTMEDDSETNNIDYMCLGVNDARPTDYSLGATIKLKVVKPKDGVNNGNDSAQNIETFLMYGSPNRTLLRGAKDNKLWCIFGGEPEPQIVWERLDGSPLLVTDYKLENHNSTLVIRNTNLTHETGFRCTASNGIGPVASHTIFVEVDMPPVFVEKFDSSTVHEGSSVTFNCEAQGSGTITYSWYFNGRHISPVQGSTRVLKGSSLSIGQVSMTDMGNYACNATSLSGYAYGQTVLSVIPAESTPNKEAYVCPEVKALRAELSTVKETLQNLQSYVTQTRTDQEDASMSLIQRIAAKLNILTEEETELLAAEQVQEEIQIETDLQKPSNNRDVASKPQTLIAERKPAKKPEETAAEEGSPVQEEAASA